MKCTWYAEFEGVCTNDECPYRGDVCPTSEYPEVCKYAEAAPEVLKLKAPRLSAKELAKTLRLCGSASCTGCALYGFYDCRSIILPQAADMLEKLAAEKDAKKSEWISVKDRLPEENVVVLICVDKGRCKEVKVSGLTGFGWMLFDKNKNKEVTHWMPMPEPPKEEER